MGTCPPLSYIPGVNVILLLGNHNQQELNEKSEVDVYSLVYFLNGISLLTINNNWIIIIICNIAVGGFST